ncbi:hypothetical protein FRC09_008331 [Ceratobasidium sp. 395]|nr:hypothetical protein FRC09_008331 [Ceratobasidium sp. 395]
MTFDCVQAHLMFRRTTLEVVLVPLSATYWPATPSYQTNYSTSPDPSFTLSCSHPYPCYRLLTDTSIYLIKTRAYMPITFLIFAPVLIHSLTPTPTALVSTCAPLAYNPTVGPWSARVLRWVRIPGCLRDQRNPDRRLGLDKTSHQFPTIQRVPGSTSTDAGRPSVRPVGLVFGFGGAVGHLVGAERQSERNDQ